MAFDIARAFAKKQEVESARLDEYWFRHRARTMSLLAASLTGRTAEPIDPKALAGQIALRTDDALLADLRARLRAPIDDDDWYRMVKAAEAEARSQLVAEFGDPDPHRLA